MIRKKGKGKERDERQEKMEVEMKAQLPQAKKCLESAKAGREIS